MKQVVPSLILWMLFSFSTPSLIGQTTYRTPSGTKYHLSTCRMVENVSTKMASDAEILSLKLEPCKICKPPLTARLKPTYTKASKAVGTGTTVQCKGRTAKGARCKHKTSLANGYCYQHTSQNSSSTSDSGTSTTSTCGARTKAGSYCRRKVKGRGRCYQHQ